MGEGNMNPEELHYSREHEWVKMESAGVAIVGVTDYAQEQLGDIVFVYFPADLKTVEQFKSFGEIESPKAVSELFAPVSGQVIEANEMLQDHPELVNEDPYGTGWMLKIKLTKTSELDNLMDSKEYQSLITDSSGD